MKSKNSGKIQTNRISGAGEELRQLRDLIETTRGLVQYRADAGPLNFQLEKADHFIRTLFHLLEAMGEADGIRKVW